SVLGEFGPSVLGSLRICRRVEVRKHIDEENLGQQLCCELGVREGKIDHVRCHGTDVGTERIAYQDTVHTLLLGNREHHHQICVQPAQDENQHQVGLSNIDQTIGKAETRMIDEVGADPVSSQAL